MPKPLPVAPPALPGTLAAALATVPDPRRPNGWRPDRPPLPLVGILHVTVAAMLCGNRSLYAVAQWARERVADDPAALVPLGLPSSRSPSVATPHRVFKRLDVAAFGAVLGQWRSVSGVAPTDALALDGKTWRGSHGDRLPGVHRVAAYAHQAGAVLAQAPSPGKGQELAAAKAVLAQAPLAGRPVTADALLTQRDLCTQVVAGEGAYLLPVDANQPALLAAVEAAFSPVDAERAGRAGSTPGAALAGGRLSSTGRRAERPDRTGAEGTPRPTRAPHALGAGRSGAQRLCW